MNRLRRVIATLMIVVAIRPTMPALGETKEIITDIQDNAPKTVSVDVQEEQLTNGIQVYIDRATGRAWVHNGTGTWTEKIFDNDWQVNGPNGVLGAGKILDKNGPAPLTMVTGIGDDPAETISGLSKYVVSGNVAGLDIKIDADTINNSSEKKGWITNGRLSRKRGWVSTDFSLIQSPKVTVFMPNVYTNYALNVWGNGLGGTDYPYAVGTDPDRWYVVAKVDNPNSIAITTKVTISKPAWDGPMSAMNQLQQQIASPAITYPYNGTMTKTLTMEANESKWLLVDQGIHGRGICTVCPGDVMTSG